MKLTSRIERDEDAQNEINPDVDDIGQEELEACSDMLNKVVSGTTDADQANEWAQEYIQRQLTQHELNIMLGRFATSTLSMREIIQAYAEHLRNFQKNSPALSAEDDRQREAIRPKRKPFTIRVNLDVYYEIDADTLPPWADDLGVEKLVECAFDDYNRDINLETFSVKGVLNQNPVEISRNSVTIA